MIYWLTYMYLQSTREKRCKTQKISVYLLRSAHPGMPFSLPISLSRDSLPFSFRPSGSSTHHKHHYEKASSDNSSSNIHQRNCHFKGKIGPKNIKETHIVQLQSHTLSIKNRFHHLHLTELFTFHSSPPSHPAKQTRHALLTVHTKLQENSI